MTSWLEINDLHAKVGDKTILNGLSLSIGAGEVHVVMGPNGSGKSNVAEALKPALLSRMGWLMRPNAMYIHT